MLFSCRFIFPASIYCSLTNALTSSDRSVLFHHNDISDWTNFFFNWLMAFLFLAQILLLFSLLRCRIALRITAIWINKSCIKAFKGFIKPEESVNVDCLYMCLVHICSQIAEGKEQPKEQTFHNVPVAAKWKEFFCRSRLAAWGRVIAWESSLEHLIPYTLVFPSQPNKQ